MGRKSKKTAGESAPVKPTCFYCLRSFENEEVLLSHQKILHFRCPSCSRKFGNAPAMGIHLKTIHDMELKQVPKAEPGRDDPTLHIVGTHGVPTEAELEEARRKKLKPASDIDLLIESVANSVQPTLSSSSSFMYPSLPLIKGLVYSDELTSPEEKRAMLPKYRIDEAALREKLQNMDASIETKLKEALAARMRAKQQQQQDLSVSANNAQADS
jgi:hypothetical protein